jgi:hypothetical protein
VKALALLLAAALVPKPPLLLDFCTVQISTVVEDKPVTYADPASNADQPGRVFRADGTAEYTFTSVCEISEPAPAPEPEDPDTFAPPPAVDPGFDEFSPTGPVDGPGEGPGEGTPADTPPP